MELACLAAQHTETITTLAVADDELMKQRELAARLEVSRNSLLMTVEAQRRHIEHYNAERQRLLLLCADIKTQATALDMRLKELERGARYVDRLLATSAKPEEHLGGVYGFGSQVMVFFGLHAPPSPRELLFGVIARTGAFDESGSTDDEDSGGEDGAASATGVVSGDESHESHAHARACYHEAKYGIVAAAAEAVLHSAPEKDD
jgi:hypothetical protein